MGINMYIITEISIPIRVSGLLGPSRISHILFCPTNLNATEIVVYVHDIDCYLF